jgi:hypothetical protein
MSKVGRNKIPPIAYSQVQLVVALGSKLPPVNKARIIAIGINVKILKNVVSLFRFLSG